ncbi:iron chelate uptake ABC transporter family permease subunit [Corynebacterium pelargi]|uniref:Iron-uptake system permease protein FeuC n=1 Tax=Corynebacterium pelargi TaxID=1471400 RepID=A0A410WA73_9CORY|nr:iron chelate uptake ABC transporter family permease subunit [Corynebacterium pelargi]QAU52844.1 Iron-uptake system permease protein FeuC [Corynebacterium pelargi]GGG76590.1 ABC-type cobalamin/Fe3+-siderophore transport system, permease [Corynebacterium pelargi]
MQTKAFAHSSRRYWILLGIIYAVGIGCAIGLLSYDNPMPFGTETFWLIAQRRLNAVLAIALVAACQAFATLAFQTVVNNRIVTPSIMGFEALYRTIHTATVFFGVAALSHTFSMFIFQLVLMVGFSLLLYAWLLGKDMHAMLLVGIVLGGGLGSLATFMQRLLTPSEFDLLTARLFGSIVNAQAQYFPIAIPLVIIGVVVLLFKATTLNVMALGKQAAQNLGLNYRREALVLLVLVSILMATSTALVGPMTFLGFLVVTLTYQLAGTEDHRYLLPLAFGLAFAILTSAYFVLNHVFYAQGVVSVIIELVGGLVFLLVLLRKGTL